MSVIQASRFMQVFYLDEPRQAYFATVMSNGSALYVNLIAKLMDTWARIAVIWSLTGGALAAALKTMAPFVCVPFRSVWLARSSTVTPAGRLLPKTLPTGW